MRRLIYSMAVSLDGYIVGPDGGFDWATPDDEVFRFATDEVRGVGVHVMGRRLYETMLYWEKGPGRWGFQEIPEICAPSRNPGTLSCR